PLAGYDQWTAVYDISAHTVYLPNGTTLEAHSGLGDRLDDPRHVRERMRGPTPADVYELALREQLFHGVQALRLKPVGGGNIAAYANSQPRWRNAVGSADDASLIEPLAA
ncbi:MAG: tlde1 domain-containing protein, partial [Methylocystis sp.]